VNDAGELDDFVDISLLAVRFLKRMLFADRKLQLAFAEYIKQLLLAYSHAIINSFLHQLLIQILLDEQHVTVNFNSKRVMNVTSKSNCILLPPANPPTATMTASANCTSSLLPHPKCKLGGIDGALKPIEASLSKTIQQLVNEIDLSLSSGSPSNSNKTAAVIRLSLEDPVTGGEKLIPNEYTLELVYNMYLKRVEEARSLSKSNEDDSHDLTLIVHQLGPDDHVSHADMLLFNLMDSDHDEPASNLLGSPLEAFVNCNGLIVLAERLPVLMPFIREPLLTITDKDRSGGSGSSDSAGKSNGQSSAAGSQFQQQLPKISPDFVDYVIMNESDGGPFIDDMYNEMPIQTTTTTMTTSLNGKLILFL
jgi:hypothetical protein